MEIYISVFALLLALSAVDVYSQRRDLKILCLAFGTVLVVLLIGLRWETGNDWRPYLEFYRQLQNFATPGRRFEPGFTWFAWLTARAGLSYTSFLTLSAAIYMTAFGVVFARFRHPTVLLLFFYCVYVLGFMGTQRQTLAMGFASLAMLKFYDRRLLAGLLLVALATTFHYTALVCVLALPVPRVRVRFAVLLGLLLSGYVLYRLDVVGTLVEHVVNAVIGDGYLVRRLIAYGAGGEWSQNQTAGPLAEVLWFVKRIALVFAFWLLCSRGKKSLDNYLVNLYALSVLLFLALWKAVPLIALRGPLYFAVFEIVLMYLALVRIGGRFKRESLVLLGGPLAAARLYVALLLYVPELYLPYKAIVLNSDYARFVY
jgi:hypothetical protein